MTALLALSPALTADMFEALITIPQCVLAVDAGSVVMVQLTIES